MIYAKHGIYEVVHKDHPKAEWTSTRVEAYGEDSAKLAVKYRDPITHNQIEFKSVIKV